MDGDEAKEMRYRDKGRRQISGRDVWWVEGGSLEPARSAIAWPREWKECMVWMASSASPPSVSATMGMQSIPASRHERLVAS